MSRKLLLADDSITIQKVIGITFVNEDFELSVVGNGDAALEQARVERPDLILADVFMPGKNGYELCAAIKSDPILGNVPVLLLTGTFEPFDEQKAAQAGADGWIAKPFESQTLINRVRELLDRAGANAHPTGVPDQAEEAIPLDESFSFGEAENNLEAAVAVDFSTPADEETAELKEIDFGDILDMDEELPEIADDQAALVSEFFTPETGTEELGAAGEIDLPAATEVEEAAAFAPLELDGEDAFAVTEDALPGEPESSASEEASFFDEEPPGEGLDTATVLDEDLSELIDEPLMAAAEDIDFSDDDGLMELSEDDLLLLDEADAFAEEAPIIETAGKPEDGISLLETVDLDAVAETETADTTLVDDDFFGGIVTSPEAETELPSSDTLAAEPDASVFEADSLSTEPEIADFESEPVLTESETSTISPETVDFSVEEPSFADASVSSAPATATPEPSDLDVSEGEAETPTAFEPTFAAVEPDLPALDTESVAGAGVKERVERLSDEDLSIIVERVAGTVVERLAGTILEKVAWEVVPDLAESLIRQEIHQIKEGLRQTG